MNGELLVLRVVHILGAIFWLGSGLFTTFFLMPSLATAGPAAGQIMVSLTKRRLFVILPTVAILTMLSGLRLMMITSAGFDGTYFQRATGKTFAVAGIGAVVAFLLSLIVARPAAVKMGALSQQAATDAANRDRLMAEISALKNRVQTSSVIAMTLLVLAAIGMAVARYL